MLANVLKKITGVPRKFATWFSKSSWKKKTVVVVVVIIIGLVVGWQLLGNGDNGYVFDTARKHTITEEVSESGIVVTNSSVNIYSPTKGVVGEVFVSNGEDVEERQKLFTVKSTATPQEKTAAFATYQAAASAVQQAENTRRATTTTVERVHDDLKDNDGDETFLQKETRTTAEVANDNAYDVLLAARAQLVSAQIAYQATQNATVVAPTSGLISNLSITDGSGVSVNSLLTPSSPILMIDGLGATEVVIHAGESDINKIVAGQKVVIEADAVDDKVYKGIVRRSDSNGTITQGVVKFGVYIEVLDSDEKLRPGMTVDVYIATDELEDVLSVPNTAVKPYQKGRAVRKLVSGDIEFIPVKIGVRGKEYTQIVEGLEDGQEIIVSLSNENVERSGLFGF